MKSIKKGIGLGNIEDAKGSLGKSAANTGVVLLAGVGGAVAGTYLGAVGIAIGAVTALVAINSGHSELASVGVGMAVGGLLTSVPEPTNTKNADGKEKGFIQKFHEKGVARLKQASTTAKNASGLAKLLEKQGVPKPAVAPVATTMPVPQV